MIDPRILQPVDVGGNFFSAYDAAAKRRQEEETRRALATLSAGNSDPRAMATLYANNPAVGMAMEDQMYQRGERGREGQYRSALGDILLGGSAALPAAAPPADPGGYYTPHATASTGPSAPLPAPSPTTPAAAPAAMESPAAPTAYERAARADPEKFLTFQGKQTEVTANQLKHYMTLHDSAMQLLGGVHDQASYDAAKKAAGELYSSFGESANQFLSSLPADYSPEAIHDLQLRGMDTSKQLGAIARENNVESMIDTREGALGERARHNRAMEARPTGRGGAGRPSTPKPATPTTVIGQIMAKQARGEPLTPAEQKTYDEYRAGRGSKKGGGGKSGPVPVNSIAEARAQPSGTMVIFKDGTVKKVP